MNTLQNYHIEFKVKTLFNRDFKILYSMNDALSGYITEHNTPKLVNSLLIEINSVLNGEKSLGGWDTQGMHLAKIEPEETKVYSDLELYEKNEKIIPNCILPTKDFRTIVEAWKDFVETEN